MKQIAHGIHLSLYFSERGNPCVATDDYELFDLVDDYLTEDCDLDDEFWIHSDYPSKGCHMIELNGETDFETLVKHIQQLDLDELERVYLINNKPKLG